MAMSADFVVLDVSMALNSQQKILGSKTQKSTELIYIQT